MHVSACAGGLVLFAHTSLFGGSLDGQQQGKTIMELCSAQVARLSAQQVPGQQVVSTLQGQICNNTRCGQEKDYWPAANHEEQHTWKSTLQLSNGHSEPHPHQCTVRIEDALHARQSDECLQLSW